MSPAETKAVKKTIKSIYATWHGCALTKREIRLEDKARGLKVGQLCDDCESMVAAHMKDLEQSHD